MRYPKDVWSESSARTHCKSKNGTFEAAKKEEKKMGNDLFYRAFETDLRKLDEEKRQIGLSFSSETEEVVRWFGVEVLSHKRGAVDLNRIRSVGSFLFAHNDERIIGPVHSAHIVDGRGEAEVGFDKTDEGELALTRIKNKSLRGVSVGYQIFEFKELAAGERMQLATREVVGREDMPVYVATRWSPTEISAVSKPADLSVGIGRAIDRNLDGITIHRPTLEEGLGMEKDEIIALFRELFGVEFGKAIKAGMPDLIQGVRAVIAEEAKPKLAFDLDIFRDLTTRATAVSPECHQEAVTMALEGKGENEILRHIQDKAMGKAGSDANRIKPGGKDPLPDDQGKKAIEQMSDEDFARMLNDPSPMTLQ